MKLHSLSVGIRFLQRRRKCGLFFLATFSVLFLAGGAGASMLHVDKNGSNPVPPYADWSTAATNIQDAVDTSAAGDLILVTNGVYQFGGRPVEGSTLTNRVTLDKAVTVQSVNGPEVTTIEGYQDPATTNGDDAVRGAYVVDGAALTGFTIEHGATLQRPNTQTNAEANGGGVWCQSSNALVSNCIIVSNACSVYGAGIYSGTLTGCRIDYNSIQGFGSYGAGAAAHSVVLDSTINSNYFFTVNASEYGAGAYYCVLSNCTINGNLKCGVVGGTLDYCTIANNTNSGAVSATLNNCTIYSNQTAGTGGGASGCLLNNCVVSNNWAGTGGGGVWEGSNPPGTNNIIIGNSTAGFGGGLYLVSISNTTINGWSILNNSAARDGGGLYFDSAGFSRGITVTNCTFEGNFSGGNGGGFCPYYLNTTVGISNCTFTGNVAQGDGGGAYYAALGNCLVSGNQAINGGGVYGTVSNCVVNGNTASGSGGGLYYFSFGMLQTIPNCEFTNNSAMNGGGSYGGYFTNCIFSANTAATNGGGVYTAALSHCLVISNQADFGGGLFEGQNTYYPGTQLSYIACEFVGNSAAANGGGIYDASSSSGPPTGTNCLFQDNSALNNGGGAFGGRFGGGMICSNSAVNGGGTYNSTVSWCSIFGNTAAGNGGGAYNGGNPNSFLIQYCILSNNVAGTNGGAGYNSSLVNCLVIGNSAAYGGGAYIGMLSSSTVAENHATIAGGGMYSPGGSGGFCSIIYDNAAPVGQNYNTSYATYRYCCTTPLPSTTTGSSYNITNDPAFIDISAANFRLGSNSPCINLANSAPGMFDLDGRPRLVGGRIDIGAYEFQGPGVGEFTAWLQQHGLPTDGSADYKDSDGDGMNNWQEWIAGTDPTDPTSLLKLMAQTVTNNATNISLTWQSVTNRTYFIQRTTDLIGEPFSILASNVLGQAGTTSFTDTNAVGAGPLFYRIGVQ
jgi:hypothetical protein